MFFIMVLGFVSALVMAELIFDGIFTDFIKLRDDLLGLERIVSKAIFWIVLLFFGGVALIISTD